MKENQLMNTIRLNSGYEIPQIALGVWQIPDDMVASVVECAIDCGYRHIDSAQAYGNERGVGEGLKKAMDEGKVTREEMFITSKIFAETKDYEVARASIDESLQKLGVEYIDLMLIHCPQPWDEFNLESHRYFEENLAVWKAMEEAVEAGKIRSIGVSNFRIDDIQNILDHAKIRPSINQCSAQIGNTPLAVFEYCQKEGIAFEAYCPNGHGAALKDEKVIELAAKYGVSPAQLCVRYVYQLGMIALPKSTNPDHIKANLDIDFAISEEDMEMLKGYKK